MIILIKIVKLKYKYTNDDELHISMNICFHYFSYIIIDLVSWEHFHNASSAAALRKLIIVIIDLSF